MIKSGFAGHPNPRRLTPNALARGKRDKRVYIGDRILNSPIAEYILSRPSQRGLVVDWECQKMIWEHGAFIRDKSGCSFNMLPDAESLTVVMTTAAFTPQGMRKEMYDVLLNDYRFNRAAVIDATVASQFSPGITSQFTDDDWQNPCGLLVDCGFSSTTVIPVFNTQPIVKASERVPVAGRILNNLLRERLAYLQVDLDDNPLLVQHIRESVCEVSTDLKEKLTQLKKSPQTANVGYLLPEFAPPASAPYTGSVVESADQVPANRQAVRVGPDRFAIPEALFSPPTFGVDKLGVAEAIVRSISLCDESIRTCLASKIIISGGTAMTPGFIARLQAELESALPQGFPVRIIGEADGRFDLSAWRGASQIAQSEDDLAYMGAVYREDWQRS